MEYEVLWGDGPLGLTLRPDLGEDMPPVVGRITRLDSAAALAKVAVGDMLVSINGIDTARQGYDHVVDLLQRIPRPATLRFRVPRPMANMPGSMGGLPRVPSMNAQQQRSSRTLAAQARGSTSSVSSSGSGAGIPTPSRKHEQYTVVWTEGPLGMILRPDDDDVHVPCIRKITGKGAGTGMDRAAVGDVLVAVNGQETKTLGFRSTISLLKSIRKPAVLKFKRMHRRLSRRRSSREDASAGGSASISSIPSGGSSHSITGVSPAMLPHSGAGGVPSSGPKEYGAYDIVWREGDLGLKLKPGDRDVPVLSKLTGKGTASGLQNATVGDELVSVNGALVEGQAYHDTLRMLKHSVKPAVLRFRPGRDRRASGMSMASISSTRSAPSTHREHNRVRSNHVPIYDTGRTPPSGPVPHIPSSHSGHSPHKPPSRSPSGERVKKKKKIPLPLAKEVVAASQGVELNQAMFAGMPIVAIEEGSHEAHLLRVEAKMYITAKGDKPPASRNGLSAKEALLQAEREAQLLQEALERVKSQAKAYEQALESQKREQLLASATRNKSGEVVQKHNLLLNELTDRIAGLKRDSYSDMDVVPMTLDDPEHIQGLMDDLQSVMNIPVVVPSTKYCAECGATEKESKLDLDDDGNYYCKDCWDNFLSVPGAGTVPVSDDFELPSPVRAPSPPPSPPSPPPAPVAPEKRYVPDLPPPAATLSPPQPSLSKGESTSSLSRLSSVEREQEEKDARVEAEKKLLELKAMSRTGSMRSMGERQGSNLNAADRTRRERRGLEELAQALQEEEERARADGNMTLAKKLSAQRARTMAEARAEQEKKLNGSSPYSSMRDLTAEPEFPRSFRNGKNGSPAPLSSSYDGPTSTIAKAADSDSDVPPPVGLKRSVTLDSPYASSSKLTQGVAAMSLAAAAASTEVTLAAAPAPANDYDDVNSDEEAEDHVEGMSDDEQDVLREQEEKNYAMAKQLGEAQNVIERARMSIMLSGDDVAEDVTGALGLSDEQISLFKKLTSQADERMSTVDRLHPVVDDSDSDSDSDESVMDADGDDDDDEDRDDDGEEDEEDEGVWI